MKKVIERSRELIRSEELKSRHRVREEDFSRVRCLTFPLLLTVILRKSVKSLQLVLNELKVAGESQCLEQSAESAETHGIHRTESESDSRSVL